MGFFLETHNGECSLGEHFCDQVKHHIAVISSSPHQLVSSRNYFDTGRTKTKTQEEELSKESALS